MTTANARDEREFQRLIDPYRHELLVHCYRILGSLDDAEDALQETLLRAWRRLDSLQVQASLRAWCYKIATNVSLDMLERRKRRALPDLIVDAADAEDTLPASLGDDAWVTPLPDLYLDGLPANPEARYEARESITLAFVAALQQLPARQRAILIFRDVLDWKAEEVADALGLSVAAVNSALQRARATMKRCQAERAFQTTTRTDSVRTEALLARYLQAWEAADAAGLVALLREDAAYTMPPTPAWFHGREAIRRFLERFIFAGWTPGRYRLIATHANGSPALAVYERDATGVCWPSALQVLAVDGDQITHVDGFITRDRRLFERFTLPDFL